LFEGCVDHWPGVAPGQCLHYLAIIIPDKITGQLDLPDLKS